MENNYGEWPIEKKMDFLKSGKNRLRLIHWFKEAIEHEQEYFLVLVTSTDGIFFSGYPQKGEMEEDAVERLTKLNDSEYSVDGAECHPFFFVSVNVEKELNKLAESREGEDKELYFQITT